MSCTAEQIAKQVGLSVSTVSRVLNNSAPVSDEARQAVLTAVQSSGSMPRLLGKRRHGRSIGTMVRPGTSLVGVLMMIRFQRPVIRAQDHAVRLDGMLPNGSFFSAAGRLANSYYRHVVDGTVGALKARGLRAVLEVTDSLESPKLLAELNSPQYAGWIVLGDYFDEFESFVNKVRRPLVSLITWNHKGWPDYVGIDNLLGIQLGFDHVYQLGHRKIGYLAGTQNVGVFRERLAAFRMKAAQAGLHDVERWIVECDADLPNMEKHSEAMLRRPDPPTAILCCYDGGAIAVRRAAEKVGLSVPDDLSVVGFDDEEIAQAFSPPLTTIFVPAGEMGAAAVHMLMMRAEQMSAATDGSAPAGFSVRVMPKLIVRESTAPPKTSVEAAWG